MRTARHLQGCANLAQLRARHLAQMAKRSAAAGDPPVALRVVTRPLVARVNDGVWLGDCDCGAGVAVEPAWTEARCFGCGAVYATVVLPDEDTRLNIEHVLAARPRRHQHWSPGERLLDLAVENAAHGVRF